MSLLISLKNRYLSIPVDSKPGRLHSTLMKIVMRFHLLAQPDTTKEYYDIAYALPASIEEIGQDFASVNLNHDVALFMKVMTRATRFRLISLRFLELKADASGLEGAKGIGWT